LSTTIEHAWDWNNQLSRDLFKYYCGIQQAQGFTSHDLNKLHFKVLGWKLSKTLIQAFEEDDDHIGMVV
jgi:hypothetical protein